MDDGKRFKCLKIQEGNDYTWIINVTESINDREIDINNLTGKRGIFSNYVKKIRKHKNYLKYILNECRCNRNKIDYGLHGKMNTLLHKYDIKREFLLGGKLNGINYRRLMKSCVDIIDGIRNIFIETSKDIVSDENICSVTNKYKHC